MSQMPANKKLQ